MQSRGSAKPSAAKSVVRRNVSDLVQLLHKQSVVTVQKEMLWARVEVVFSVTNIFDGILGDPEVEICNSC
jgi:hypothetical protein